MNIKECSSGKIRNPASGRCVNKNSPVLKTIKIVPSDKFNNNQSKNYINNVLVNCDKNKFINPKTKRCVQFKNKDIQYYLKKGYKLQTDQNKKLDITKPAPIPKVPINNPKNIKDKDIKVLVPPNPQETVKLIYCGKGKVINPVTGRCILLSSPLGKKLTSVPYIIINPPSKPQKTPLFIPDPAVPRPQKGPVQKKTYPKIKTETIKTALDTDGDNYVSVREYLDAVESLGPREKSKGLNFAFYNQRDIGILFLLALIKNLKGPIHKIGCIPLFYLCIYKNPSGVFYTMENINKMNKLSCPNSSDYQAGSNVSTYASIVILNAPLNSDNYKKNNMSILFPPNLSELLYNCEKDNKYMVVCDLTLLITTNTLESSHANVLVFDTRRKTIERFDPHGGNEYSDVRLAYDPDSEKEFGRKDFMYGKYKFGDNVTKKLSRALFDQFTIDKGLANKFKQYLPNYTYYGTNHTTPYLGPQIKADDYDGLCVTWSCMYMVLRLLNPDLEPAEITLKMIDGTPKELKNRILRFQKFMIRILSEEKQSLK